MGPPLSDPSHTSDIEASMKVMKIDDTEQHSTDGVNSDDVDSGNADVTSNPNAESANEQSKAKIAHESLPSTEPEDMRSNEKTDPIAAVEIGTIEDKSNDTQNEPQTAAKQNQDGRVNNRQTVHKTVADLIEMATLERAGYKPASNATEAERAEERRRVLSDLKTRHRFIFARWPRDLAATKPSTFSVDCFTNKTAPNEIQFWGASLLHFYYVEETAKWAPGPWLRKTTASKMLRWVRHTGEENYESARCWVQLAQREKDPELIKPCNIAPLIIAGEAMQRDMILRMRSRVQDGDEEIGENEILFPRAYPIESVFTADTYPTGWVREPFSNPHMFFIAQPPTLQQYIPQHLLPRKLIIHDRCNLLHVSETRERQEIDITHIYKLQPSMMYSDRRKLDEAEMIEQEAASKVILDKFLADPHTRNVFPRGFCLPPPSLKKLQPGPVRPFMFLVSPTPCPRGPAQEGHMYIDRDHVIGKGHHSFVYSAELELPRNFLVPLQLCRQCIFQDLKEQLQAIYGPDKSSIDPKFNEEIGRLVHRNSSSDPIIFSPEDSDNKYILDEGKLASGLAYEGPLRVLHSRVQYHNPEEGPYCEHLRKTAVHPLTTKVRVAAKLSVQDDDHLAQEACNYQHFPRHFFEHWSGLNIVPLMDEPVPIGPIVPQFYGYYVLDEEAEHGSPISAARPYLSPILLLEDCGRPIKPETLSADDKSECASLIYRFNDAEWAHRSIYKRNILEQKGPLSKWPSERQSSSFRLIDFGRSIHAEDVCLDDSEDEDMDPHHYLNQDLNTISDWVRGSQDLA